MITGFNTDIEYNGQVYHVQTEDKGVDNPVIESLIYIGGEILGSRKLPYSKILTDGYDEKAIVKLMEDEGYRSCLASVYPMDVHVPAFIVRRQFLANVRPGAILVLHDGSAKRSKTVRVLDDVLPLIAERGYRALTVSELVELGQ